MLASVSCISSRLTQILRFPTLLVAAPDPIAVVTISGCSVACRTVTASPDHPSARGFSPLNTITPRASVTSTRSISRSSSSRPAIEAMAAVLRAAKAVESSVPVTLPTLFARASRSPSSFCSTVA